jgi:alanine-synthesizing transaminase
MFSNRTNWDLTSNRYTEVSTALKASGAFLYDLTVSNPTQCGFQYPLDRILKALLNPSNMAYTADPRGLMQAREAVVEYYRSHYINVSADRIFLTASTSEAYGFLFRLLANPGDKVIFPKPGYPLFEFLAGLHDLDWGVYSLAYNSKWALDQPGFHAVLTDGAAAVILVNPNNPTGSVLDQAETREIMRSASERGIPVICDEVFLDYGHSDLVPGSLAGYADSLTFVLGGLSKSLALPQMKCSWIVVNGPQELVEKACSRLEIIADTFLSVNTPVQNALADWMDIRENVQGQVLSRIRANKKFFEIAAAEAGDGIELLKAEAGWSMVARSVGMEDEESFVLSLLQDDHVCVHPGYFFDFDAPGYAVISLLPEEPVFQEGIRRMLKRLAG